MSLQSNFRSNIGKTVIKLISLTLITAFEISAQMPQVRVPPEEEVPAEDYTWWYISLFLLVAALVGAITWVLKSKKAEKDAQVETARREKQRAEDNSWEHNSVDADKEMEWYRKHKKAVAKNSGKNKKDFAKNLPQTGRVLKRKAGDDEQNLEFSEQEFKEKLQNIQYTQLPVFNLHKLEVARPFAPLSISNDDALMSAIEQTHDEYEEDEEVRDLAVRILARFKTRNAVEALSQVALYDLSSNLRSKAVSILADSDHESVFETVLLCCADPTREVRAAAARGLFRLNFDRADAWTRIAEIGDQFRMSQAALAAKEADLVKRSFDRLVHQDQKIAFEAVALINLMIRAGEVEEIFSAIEKHSDENVKLALLHVVGLAKDENTLSNLYEILERSGISMEMKNKVDDIIQSFEMIPA